MTAGLGWRLGEEEWLARGRGEGAWHWAGSVWNAVDEMRPGGNTAKRKTWGREKPELNFLSAKVIEAKGVGQYRR